MNAFKELKAHFVYTVDGPRRPHPPLQYEYDMKKGLFLQKPKMRKLVNDYFRRKRAYERVVGLGTEPTNLNLHLFKRKTWAFTFNADKTAVWIGSTIQHDEDRFIKSSGRIKAKGKLMSLMTSSPALPIASAVLDSSIPEKVRRTIYFEATLGK